VASGRRRLKRPTAYMVAELTSPGLNGRRPKSLSSIGTTSRPRRASARVWFSTFGPRRSEGAGNAGRLVRPQPRVVIENTRVSHHGHTGNTRHSPRNGLNGFLRAHPGDRALLSPSPAQRASVVARLMSASGHQAHTTSPSEIARFVNRANPGHRIRTPRFVTIAIRPS
jgi:hypothetical protein